MEKEDSDDDTVCLDESFFVNRNYELTTFTFGTHVLHLRCLQSASSQVVWPGAVLLNNYVSKNAAILEGRSVIELGSGVGITGILCSRFCCNVVLTGHDDEVLEASSKHNLTDCLVLLFASEYLLHLFSIPVRYKTTITHTMA